MSVRPAAYLFNIRLGTKLAPKGMVMDWREMAGWPTVHGLSGDDRRGWSAFRGAYSDGEKVGTGTWIDPFKDGNYYQWDGRTDPARGWVIAFCWLIASGAE